VYRFIQVWIIAKTRKQRTVHLLSESLHKTKSFSSLPLTSWVISSGLLGATLDGPANVLPYEKNTCDRKNNISTTEQSNYRKQTILYTMEQSFNPGVHKYVSRKPVLVNRVYCTPQGVPGFSSGVPPRRGVQGCTRYVASHSMFFALAQCANLSQALKSYIGECELPLFSLLFVMLVKWPSRILHRRSQGETWSNF